MQEIPLNNGASNSHQTFTVKLCDNVLDFALDYISYTDKPAWTMTVSQDGINYITGAMLVPNAEVSKAYRAGLGRFFFVGDEVTIDNLGVDNHLLWVPE